MGSNHLQLAVQWNIASTMSGFAAGWGGACSPDVAQADAVAVEREPVRVVVRLQVDGVVAPLGLCQPPPQLRIL